MSSFVRWFLNLWIILVNIMNFCLGQALPFQVNELKFGEGQLIGQLVSATGTPVAGGHLVLLRLDSSLVKITASDSLGRFAFFKLVNGSYIIRASKVGYATVVRPVTSTDTLTKQPITITLQTQTQNLDEVTIKEKRPLFEILGDRIVLNVAANPVLSAGSTFDALGAVPRITTNAVNKTISVDGKNGIILYQNGRQLYLTPDQIYTYLQSLPANAIARIEILTSPSAQYDAGSSAIILLFTKTLTTDGFAGEASLSTGFGRYEKANGSVNLSVRLKKVQGSLQYEPTYRPTYFSWNSEQRLGQTKFSQNERVNSREFNQVSFFSHLVRTNWEWFVTKSITVGSVLQASWISGQDRPSSTITYLTSESVRPRVQLESATQFRERITNVAANFNVRKQFNNQTSLSSDFDVARYINNSISTAHFTPIAQDKLSTESVRVFYPNNVWIRTAKLDLTTRAGSKGQLELGAKYSSVSMDNVPSLNQYSPSFSSLIPLLAKSYVYNERIASAYGNVAYKWSVWSVQAGLRIEHTNYEGVAGQTSNMRKNYLNFFPSVSLEYATPQKHQITLSANRRIVRPGFDLLNPAYIFYDPLTLYSGNPSLLPQLTTTLQGVFTTAKRLSVAVVYSDTRNRIAEVVYRLDSASASTVDHNINFDWEKRLAVTLTVPIKVSKAWLLQAVGTAAHARFYSTFQDTPTLLGQLTATFRLNNQINWKKWSGNFNFVYRSKAVVGYMYYDPLWYVDLGVQRSFGEQSSLKLTATDIFHTFLITNYGRYLNTDIIFRHRIESQKVLLTYSFRFGNKKAKQLQNRNFGSESEQERLGGKK
ncbi:outer membrane beta-barrel protein [Fibrisoma limi]|nr:outer membrane beta-barrel protein [Fibrisoma limi]